MKELIDKLREISREIATERGQLSLVGLFQREYGIGKWDIVVAAPWMSKERTADIPYLAGKIQEQLPVHVVLSVATVVPLHSSVPFVKNIQEMVGEVDGLKELPAFDFDGMELRRGYVLISHPEAEPAPRVEMSTA
jgi:hypothetical protein